MNLAPFDRAGTGADYPGCAECVRSTMTRSGHGSSGSCEQKMSFVRLRITARRALLGTVALLLGVLGLQVPAHAGGVFIIITGIHVGSPVMGTEDSCNGWVQHN